MDGSVGQNARTGIVTIGRNEGERLKQCLRSLPPNIPAVYVDSGSTDGSIEFARGIGIEVIELDMSIPFTAARARNVGWRRLVSLNQGLEFVKFIDGDCELDPQWLDQAIKTLEREGRVAGVFGRRRERYPEATIYNRMCDDEWNTPIGEAESCGGDVLFRVSALRAVDGYSNALIAGEEPDLCLRLRREGWTLLRVDAAMTLHDAAISSFSAFWKRTERGGFAYAEHVWIHGNGAIPSWRRQLFGIIFWGLMLPLLLLICIIAFVSQGCFPALVATMVVLSLYPLQITRVARNKATATADSKFVWEYASLVVVGKVAQAIGVLRCWGRHMMRRPGRLIEYKGL